jgi:transposase
VARTCLTDAHWERMAPLVPGKVGDPGATGRDNRLFVEAVLWIVRTGAPWRDLPSELGNWNSVWRRFARWAERGIWERLFAAMADDPDFEYVIVDAAIVRAHQHSAGAKGGLRPRPSAARVAACPPSFTSPSMPSATPCACSSPQASGMR